MIRIAALLGLLGCEAGQPLCLEERFDRLDPDRWTVSAGRPGSEEVVRVMPAEVVVTGGALVITPAVASDEQWYVRGKTSYDVAGGTVEIEFPQLLTPARASESEVVLRRDAGNYAFLGFTMDPAVEIRTVDVRQMIGGTQTQHFVTFDDGIRFGRFVLAADTVEIQTSVDGKAWTTKLAAQPLGFAADALHVELEVDSHAPGVAVPGAVGFDNLVIAGPGCPAMHGPGPAAP